LDGKTAKRTSSIERNLLLLSGVALGLFTLLVAALFVVQGSMAAQQRRLEQVVVPLQQEVSGLEGAIAAAFAREADMASTVSTAELEPLRDRAAIEQGLSQSRDRLLARSAEAGDSDLRERAKAVAAAVDQFLDGDAALYASVMKSHTLDANFRAQLGLRNGELRDEILRVDNVAGRAKLANVLLLRRIAAGGGGLREIVTGDVRARESSAQDLRGSIQRFAMLVALLGTVRDADALNSTLANEMPQSRARVVDDLGELADLAASDADVGAVVAGLQDEFGKTVQHVSERSDPESLVALRYAAFAERARAAQIRAGCRTTAQRLLVGASAVEGRAHEVAANASRSAASMARVARFGSLVLAFMGVGVCVFSARRIAFSVAELRSTNRHLSDLKQELLELNEGLEQTVAERTRELQLRERSLQLVLDATGNGLVSVSTDGELLAVRSRAMGEWFGHDTDARIWELLFPNDARRALAFELGWAQLVSDDLPFELTLDQMPKQIAHGERLLELDFKPVREDGLLASVLVTIEDVTARRAAERAERAAREAQSILANVLKDPAGFRRAMADLAELALASSRGRDPVEVRRALHTLKGNAGLCGFSALAERCHAIENSLAATDSALLSKVDADGLETVLKEAVARVDHLVGPQALDRIEVTLDDLAGLVRLLEDRRDHGEALAWIDRWRQEPTRRPLGTLAAQARRVAERLRKEIEVVVVDGNVRVDADAFSPIWTNLGHAIRNAIDHGIEHAAVRAERGKPAHGTVVLRTEELSGEAVLLEVSDDGGGVDFDAVSAAAERRGLPTATRQDLIDALFADGLTTRAGVSELSGRGVGLAALRAATLKLGGSVSVETAPGVGTTLRLRFPLASRRHAESRRGVRALTSPSRPPPPL
jgi:two-component system chemotaxis sensor kinase CheA